MMNLPVLQGVPSPMEGVALGTLYLIRAYTTFGTIGPEWWLRPIYGDDNLIEIFTGTLLQPRRTHGSPDEGLVYFVPTYDTEMLDTTISHIRPRLDLIDLNTRTVAIVGTGDLNTTPFAADESIPNALVPVYGRLPNHYDYLTKNPVVAVNAVFLSRNNINVGDFITITLRNLPRPHWMDTNTDISRLFSTLGEGWWASSVLYESAPMWVLTSVDYAGLEVDTAQISLEIIGSFRYRGVLGTGNLPPIVMFVPDSVIPPNFGWGSDEPLLSGMYSFVLDSPRSKSAFLDEITSELMQIGFSVGFVETGGEGFLAFADSVLAATALNLAIACLVFVFGIALAALVYLRQASKIFAIYRALGVSGRGVVLSMFSAVLPMLLIACLIGIFVAWALEAHQVESSLAGLAEFAAEPWQVGMSVITRFILVVGVFAGMLASFLAGTFLVVKKPILGLLQGIPGKK